MGTPDFALGPLDLLLKSGYKIVAVITAPDRPAGRGKRIKRSPVKEYALNAGIDLLQPENLKDEQFLNQLSDYNADLQIVVAFRILPEAVWNMPPLGTFNLHASVLPQYRGAAPINWAIINGEKETGVTTFFLDQKVDTGKIIFTEKTNIGEDETFGELHNRLKSIGAELVLKTVITIEDHNYHLLNQEALIDNNTVLKIAPRIFKEDCRISWSDDINNIYNLIRGLSPYPGAFTELKSPEGNKHFIKIYRTKKEVGEHDLHQGEFITDGKSYLKVGVKGGFLFLEEVQLASKRKMNIHEFLLGFNISSKHLFF